MKGEPNDNTVEHTLNKYAQLYYHWVQKLVLTQKVKILKGEDFMHLWIIRHGHCGSDSPDSDLTPLGELQAYQTAQRLIKSGSFIVLSSPLVRALGTASIIAETLNTSVEVWPNLREGFSWTHHAYSRQILLQRFPRVLLPIDFAVDGWEYGNDTYQSMVLRCQQSLYQLKERFNADDHIAIVTHGGFANYLLHSIVNLPQNSPLWFEMSYCAISRVYFVPEQQQEHWPLYPAIETKILSINDYSHLSHK